MSAALCCTISAQSLGFCRPRFLQMWSAAGKASQRCERGRQRSCSAGDVLSTSLMYISLGTLTVVLISSTPGAGGSRTRRRTGMASADDTPMVVPGRKEPPAGAMGAPCKVGDSAG